MANKIRHLYLFFEIFVHIFIRVDTICTRQYFNKALLKQKNERGF